MYPHNHGFFDEKDSHTLPDDIVTLSERMQILGYYTVNVMSGGDGIYNGITRGYDRLIVTPYYLYLGDCLERIMNQLDAFDECDQFVMAHVMDIHTWEANSYHFPLAVQTKLALTERLTYGEKKLTGVHLPVKPLYQANFLYQIHRIDRLLAYLYQYIEEHYQDDEYILSIYSDHGQSVFDAARDLVSENSVGALWLMWGSNVPSIGVVDELTSTLDIYPTLGKLVGFIVADNINGNLPEVFGGKAREYVASYARFTGQKYHLSIKNHDMYFRLLTDEVVSTDGTVDFSAVHDLIATRDKDPKLIPLNDELRNYFYPIARELIKKVASNGEKFPSIK